MHREPIDSTFYEPNVIVSPKHEAMRPKGPEDYGVRLDDLSCETRQGRNVVKTWAETEGLAHPLAKDGYQFVFHTPKYRHGAHTMPIDTDMSPCCSARSATSTATTSARRSSPRATSTSTPRTPRELASRTATTLDRLRSRGPAVPRLAEERPRTTSSRALLPRALLPRHAARRDAHVVQHVRRDAGLGGGPEDARRRPRQEPAHELPGDVPLRLAPVGDARLAQADAG